MMGLENVLDHAEGFVARFDRERGRDPGLYYLRVFGEPGGAAPWGWRFGGHHVSLNNLVVDGEVVATTPCFLGADPATSPLLGGAALRPLARVEDLARDLVRSLPPRARRAGRAAGPGAVGPRHRQPDPHRAGRPGDPADRDLAGRASPTRGEQAKLQATSDAIDAAAGYDDADHGALAYTAVPKGLPAAELDAAQREMLRRCSAPTSAGSRTASPRWTGTPTTPPWTPSTSPGPARPSPVPPHYYRVQGPRLLVEWDNTQRGANHAHSVWRDPAADFGLDVLAARTAPPTTDAGPERRQPTIRPRATTAITTAMAASRARHAAGRANSGRSAVAPAPSAQNHSVLAAAAPAANHQRCPPRSAATEPSSTTVSR